MAVKIRKLLIGAMYGKLGKLSVKSVASTNSGKLITLVSADIFMVERGLAFTPLVFSAPIINIAVVIVVGITTHWSNSIIVFVFYITMLGCQTLSG
jgi:ABC-type transport system involved in cytochrome bd biosynthesis fused ATPase/permease subunit